MGVRGQRNVPSRVSQAPFHLGGSRVTAGLALWCDPISLLLLGHPSPIPSGPYRQDEEMNQAECLG